MARTRSGGGHVHAARVGRAADLSCGRLRELLFVGTINPQALGTLSPRRQSCARSRAALADFEIPAH